MSPAAIIDGVVVHEVRYKHAESCAGYEATKESGWEDITTILPSDIAKFSLADLESYLREHRMELKVFPSTMQITVSLHRVRGGGATIGRGATLIEALAHAMSRATEPEGL